MSIFLGIDPGLDGGIVALDATGAVIAREVMPTLKAGTGEKRTLDTGAVVFELRQIVAKHCRHESTDDGLFVSGLVVALEELGSRPAERMGAASAISIGRNHGRIEGVLVALGIRYDLVRPQAWQKALGLGSDGDPKQRSIAFCRRMFPGLDLRANERCRTPHDGLADGACLAEYSRRVLGNIQAGAAIGGAR